MTFEYFIFEIGSRDECNRFLVYLILKMVLCDTFLCPPYLIGNVVFAYILPLFIKNRNIKEHQTKTEGRNEKDYQLIKCFIA